MAGSWSSVSDRSTKNSIENINEKYYKAWLNIEPVQYLYNDQHDTKKHLGFVAQDVEKALNNQSITRYETSIIQSEDNQTLALDYNNFIALNMLAIKKNKQQIDINKMNIEQLYRLLAEIDNRLKQLES